MNLPFESLNVFIKPLTDRYGREVFWVLLGQAGAVVGGIYGVRVLTQILSPASYGELAIGMTVGILIQQTVMGAIINASVRYYSAAIEIYEFDHYLRAVTRILFLAVASILIIAILISGVLFVFKWVVWIPLCIVSILYSVISSTNNLFDGMQNAARQRKVVAIHQGLSQILRMSLAWVAVQLFGSSSFIAMSGYVVGAVLILGSQVLFFQRTVHHSLKVIPIQSVSKPVNWAKRLFDFGWPFSAYGLFTWAHISSDRWVLARFSTIEHVGYYSVLFQLGFFPISLLTDMLLQLIVPVLYARSGDATDPLRMRNVHRLNFRITTIAFGLTACFVVIAALFHDAFFSLLVAGGYRQVSYLWHG